MLIASKASLDKPFANGEFFKSSSLHYGGTILAFACVNSDFTLFKMLVEAGESLSRAAVMIVPQPQYAFRAKHYQYQPVVHSKAFLLPLVVALLSM